MATVINTNIFELPGTITGQTRYYQLILDIVSQDAVKNTTTISWSIYVRGNYTGWIAEQYAIAALSWEPNYSVGDSGYAELFYSASRVERDDGLLTSGTLTIPHLINGTRTINASIGAQVYYNGDGYSYNCNGSASLTFPTIYQKAELVSTPDFNDEGNPTITYRNPLGENADFLKACISIDASFDSVPFRDVPKDYNGTYTFYLTEEERNTLRVNTSTSDSRIVYFSLATSVGGQVHYDKVPVTFYVINSEPTLNPTVEDIDADALVLTGNKNIILRNISDVQFNSGAVAKKGATIVSQTITCGAQSVTNTTGTGSFHDVNSENFVFTMVDSRGKKVTQTVTKQLISYIDLTCNIWDATAPDGVGNFKFMTRGSYYGGSLGAISNSLRVQYRFMEEGGEYSEWTDMTVSADKTMFTSYVYISGLDYQTRYIFQARAQDEYHKLLGTWIETSEKIIQGLPVFDWSREDFNFNVPVTIQGGSVDAIIEQGYENGWYYKKWACGLAECAYTYTGKVTLSNNLAGVFYTPSIAIDYPFDFASAPVVTVSGGSVSTINWARVFGGDVTHVGFTIVGNTEQPNVDVVVHIQVYGKWR
jgi:hypothetical protein